MKNMVVGPELTPDWVKKVGTMLSEIFRQLALWFKEPGKGLSLDQLQLFIEHKNPFARTVDSLHDLRRAWERFYLKYFNLTLDFSGIRIPKHPGEGWRLLVIAQGITPEQAFQVCSKHFKTWKYTNQSLDEIVIQNERIAKESYAIWVREDQEADEVHKNKSADEVKEQKLLTETLTERLIHELIYYDETGNHLDIRKVTLCSGSRCSGGHVPHVFWNDDRLSVYWYFSDYHGEHLRSREVVS